jgi:hypothetical protein
VKERRHPGGCRRCHFTGCDPFPGIAVEGPMTKKDKIAFIKSSKRKTHVYNDLNRYSDQQLDDVIREIVQGLIRESEIIANAYINGYR